MSQAKHLLLPRSRKHGLELSQPVTAGLASAAAKRRKASAPRFGALPRSCTFRSRHLIVWRGHGRHAPFGAPPPSLYEPGANLKVFVVVVVGKPRARSASRELIFISSLPGLTRQSMRPRSLFRFSAWFRWPHFSMDHRVKPGGDEWRAARVRGLSVNLSRRGCPLTPTLSPHAGRGSAPLTGRALSCHVARLLWGMIFSENRHPPSDQVRGQIFSGSCLK